MFRLIFLGKHRILAKHFFDKTKKNFLKKSQIIKEKNVGEKKMLSSYLCHLSRTVLDQSSSVHPVSESWVVAWPWRTYTGVVAGQDFFFQILDYIINIIDN